MCPTCHRLGTSVMYFLKTTINSLNKAWWGCLFIKAFVFGVFFFCFVVSSLPIRSEVCTVCAPRSCKRTPFCFTSEVRGALSSAHPALWWNSDFELELLPPNLHNLRWSNPRLSLVHYFWPINNSFKSKARECGKKQKHPEQDSVI